MLTITLPAWMLHRIVDILSKHEYTGAAEIIAQIQTITAPYTPHPQEPNGVADNYTRAAICRWQLKHNITPDGIARRDTLDAMGIYIKEENNA